MRSGQNTPVPISHRPGRAALEDASSREIHALEWVWPAVVLGNIRIELITKSCWRGRGTLRSVPQLQVAQDFFYDGAVADQADDFQWCAAAGTDQGVSFVGLCFILHLPQFFRRNDPGLTRCRRYRYLCLLSSYHGPADNRATRFCCHCSGTPPGCLSHANTSQARPIFRRWQTAKSPFVNSWPPD